MEEGHVAFGTIAADGFLVFELLALCAFGFALFAFGVAIIAGRLWTRWQSVGAFVEALTDGPVSAGSGNMAHIMVAIAREDDPDGNATNGGV